MRHSEIIAKKGEKPHCSCSSKGEETPKEDEEEALLQEGEGSRNRREQNGSRNGSTFVTLSLVTVSFLTLEMNQYQAIYRLQWITNEGN